MSSFPDDLRVKRAAAEWLTKHDRGLTPGEQDQFFQWLAADPRHGAWFSRHRDGWRRLDRLAEWRPEHGSEPNPDVLARPAHRPRWARPLFIGALAASLAFAAVGFWPSAPSFNAAPIAARTSSDGYERRVLEDGSVVELNHGAEIDVHFTAAERRVVLRRGEALFTVAKNPLRRFVVRARGVDVRALGTEFNVRLETASVAVLVTEGRVQVAPPALAPSTDPLPTVVAGEHVLVSLNAGIAPQITKTTEAQLEQVRSWRPQLLDFSSTPLAQVLAELNRRNRVQIVLNDPASARVPVVASIRSDNIEGFVSQVTTAVGLRAERRGEYEIVLHAAR